MYLTQGLAHLVLLKAGFLIYFLCPQITIQDDHLLQYPCTCHVRFAHAIAPLPSHTIWVKNPGDPLSSVSKAEANPGPVLNEEWLLNSIPPFWQFC